MQPQSKSDARNSRIKQIRRSLQTIPIMSKNTDKVKETQKNCVELSEMNQKNGHRFDDQVTPLHKDSFCQMSQFDQKYQIFEKLGEGSNGVVRKCLHRTKKQVYAVKTINIDEEHIYFLKKNFIAVQRLNHSSIVSYKSLYIDRKKNICNLVMEYVEWPNLLQINIDGQQKMKKIMYQIFKTIIYMHQNLICHRDLKPQNILYNQSTGFIKIIDFGVSKTLKDKNIRKQMLTLTGTLFYRAPEMFLGGSYNQTIDQWAAAVTLYQLVSKKTPFQSEYHSQTIQNIIKGQVNFDQQCWYGYSHFIKDLMKRIFRPPKFRLNASQICSHPWFTTSSSLVIFEQFSLTRSLTYTNRQPQSKGSWELDSFKLGRLNSVINQEQLIIGKWLDDEGKDFIDSEGQNNQKEKKQQTKK